MTFNTTMPLIPCLTTPRVHGSQPLASICPKQVLFVIRPMQIPRWVLKSLWRFFCSASAWRPHVKRGQGIHCTSDPIHRHPTIQFDQDANFLANHIYQGNHIMSNWTTYVYNKNPWAHATSNAWSGESCLTYGANRKRVCCCCPNSGRTQHINMPEFGPISTHKLARIRAQ